MFDFRYHALSLVSVFLALMIGLLLGVAIGDEGLVSSAEKNVRDSLRGDVREAQAESARLRGDLAERRRFEGAVYPLLVDGRLTGRRVALVALGGLPGGAIRSVRGALENTDGRLAGVAVIREPLPAGAAPTAPAPPGAPPPAPDEAALKRFGAQAGLELVRGRLTAASRRTLFESSSGNLTGLNGIVLLRAPRKGNQPEAAQTDAFEEGFVEGMVSAGPPVVGVELTTTDPSQIGWYKERRLASVDNLDELAGRAALVFALAGASGAFGIKDSAEALLPTAAEREAPAPTR